MTTMIRKLAKVILSVMGIGFMISCNSTEKGLVTKNIFVTSASGDKMATRSNVSFQKGTPDGIVIAIDPDITKQTIDGIGSSVTEASAYVLAHLDPEKRREVMHRIFSAGGANFSLTRIHIGACDFCVNGKYSYLDHPGDTQLNAFSIDPDKMGFSRECYPGIVEEKYDLLPMIKEAIAIKKAQDDTTLNIVASAWTAPSWMKDIEDWYIPGTPENNYQGTGGQLKPEYEGVYADYLVKYLEVYRDEGVDIWAITPVNEPHGNNGQWESMHFTPESQNRFIKTQLGPKLQSGENANIKLLIYDQNRDGLEPWATQILGDKETSQFVYGSAVHWYESTVKVYEEVFDRVHAWFPSHAIIHTEGCIDDLGKDAPEGIRDPIRFKERDWFNNDAFWWGKNATDWAYTAAWPGVVAEDHPIYVPVHRYARNIIVSIDHWVKGWIDWNVVLDHNGGPNHVGNFCGAPIMIDTRTQLVYYTPVYYVLAQFSQTIRPGDRAVKTQMYVNDLDNDALHTCATLNTDKVLSVQLLNTTPNEILYQLKIKDQFASLKIDANSLQTIQIQL
ncbi:MAG: glycosyl hydrolase [Bacteroidia bacterium]|nr:glycosyl hydrolase [Bacteroidia bacterium]